MVTQARQEQIENIIEEHTKDGHLQIAATLEALAGLPWASLLRQEGTVLGARIVPSFLLTVDGVWALALGPELTGRGYIAYGSLVDEGQWITETTMMLNISRRIKRFCLGPRECLCNGKQRQDVQVWPFA